MICTDKIYTLFVFVRLWASFLLYEAAMAMPHGLGHQQVDFLTRFQVTTRFKLTSFQIYLLEHDFSLEKRRKIITKYTKSLLITESYITSV